MNFLEMKLEDLPGELWFLILSYLSPLEAFYTFKSINNRRIYSILIDMYLIRQVDNNSSLKLNISLACIPLFMYNFAMSNIISHYSNLIQSLKLSNVQTPGQINDFIKRYSFQYVKSLCLIEPTSDELNIIVKDLANVKMLDIQSKSMHSFDVDTIKTILYSKPSINSCCLTQFYEDFISIDSYSFIQTLKIDSCDYLCFINILNHFCLLENLSINSLSISQNTTLTSNNLTQNPILIKDLQIRALSIPFHYFLLLFPSFEKLQRFSLSIMCDEGS